MGKADDIKDKIKGEANKIKGGLKQDVGDNVGGTMDKIKGEAQEKGADIKQKWDEFTNDKNNG